jgi:hypothetical protein
MATAVFREESSASPRVIILVARHVGKLRMSVQGVLPVSSNTAELSGSVASPHRLVMGVGLRGRIALTYRFDTGDPRSHFP